MLTLLQLAQYGCNADTPAISEIKVAWNEALRLEFGKETIDQSARFCMPELEEVCDVTFRYAERNDGIMSEDRIAKDEKRNPVVKGRKGGG